MLIPTMKRDWTPEVGAAQDGGQSTVLSIEALRGRALAMLARREHSRGEIQKRLLAAGADEPAVECVLDELQARRLQSDDRFAEVFIRSKAERGYGPLFIGRELKDRGLSQEAIQAALEASGYDWDVQAVALRLRRFGSSRIGDTREKLRQYRFLQYRGFSSSQIARALGDRGSSEDW
jgi:regulatory protein